VCRRGDTLLLLLLVAGRAGQGSNQRAMQRAMQRARTWSLLPWVTRRAPLGLSLARYAICVIHLLHGALTVLDRYRTYVPFLAILVRYGRAGRRWCDLSAIARLLPSYCRPVADCDWEGQGGGPGRGTELGAEATGHGRRRCAPWVGRMRWQRGRCG
jgi:hypothetical protein